MITNKDIRVDNGNLVLNGDKYPLDGQSPEAIMEIVEDNSDSTPTENSNAPVKSGGVFSVVTGLSDSIGDLSRTGIPGADVAAQLGVIAGQIGDINFAVLEQEFTNVTIDTAWGSLYESSSLNIDLTSLDLSEAPKAVILSIKQTTTAVLIGVIAPGVTSASSVPFHLIRTSALSTGATFKVSALVIY